MNLRAPALLRACRPKQWTKNLVVLAAPFFALGDHAQVVDRAAMIRALIAFAGFCALSSAVYLVNDVRDRARDRLHPTKRFRPVAAGELSVGAALGAAAALLAVAGGLAALLPAGFALCAGLYLAIQILYTFVLKHVALLDIFVIAGGFVLRALSGAAAAGVLISPWLVLCTFLLAMFLALCKRRHEKVAGGNGSDEARPSLGGYDERMLDLMVAIMAAATIVCYALYTLAPETVAKFGSPRLGFTIPFVVFGIFRYLHLVYRLELGDRPEQILLTDPPLLASIALFGLTVLGIVLTH